LDVSDVDTPTESSPYPPLPPPPPSITLTPLLGTTSEQPLVALYASQIATLVWTSDGTVLGGTGNTRPVVVGVALKGGGSDDPAVFHGVMALVRELLQQ
jgi:proteasome assembly chaperone 3